MSHYPGVFWSAERLGRAALCLVLALGFAAVLTWYGDTAGRSMLRCGDFPGFYAPAKILALDRGGELYSRALQLEIENQFWPGMEQQVLVSVYPAFFAVVLLPLAHLPPEAAKWVFAAFCFAGVLLFAAVGVPPEQRRALPLRLRLAVLSLFPPSFISLVGGQNTGLTLGLLAVVMWGLARPERGSRLIAGVALAALLYKPQFGLMLLWPMLLWRQWWVLVAVAGIAPMLYLLAVPWAGVAWIASWLQAVSQFAPENFLVNGRLMISPLSALHLLGVAPSELWGLTLCGLGYAAIVLWMTRRSGQVTPELRAAVVAWTAVFSPQALFYDLGLVAPLLLLNIIREGDAAVRRILLWGVLIAVAESTSNALAAPLMQCVTIGMVFVECRRRGVL